MQEKGRTLSYGIKGIQMCSLTVSAMRKVQAADLQASMLRLGRMHWPLDPLTSLHGAVLMPNLQDAVH